MSASTTTTVRTLPLALLVALSLVTGACAAGGEEAEIEVVPAGQAVGAAAGDEEADAGDTADADADAGADTGADDAATGEEAGDDGAAGSGAGVVPDEGLRNRKIVNMRTIDDFSEAEPVRDDADELDLVFDEVNEGEIESEHGTDRWSFEATDGELIALDMLDIGSDCSMDLELMLESPSGRRGYVEWVGNGGCSLRGPFSIDETGTWVVELRGGDGSVITDNTGRYRFVPVRLTEVDVTPLSFDTPQSGEISEGFGVDLWTFEATAGSTLTVEATAIGDECSMDLTLAVIDPFEEWTEVSWIGNGACTTIHEIELDQDGIYAVEFSGGDGGIITDNTGTYTFTATIS